MKLNLKNMLQLSNKHSANIKNILKKSKVKVVKSTVILDSKTAVWKLKVKK